MVWTVYYTDDGTGAYALQVDADYAADPTRGWNSAGVEGAQLFPRRAEPRRVFGVSPTTGRRGSTIVGTTAAPLWTGGSLTFFVFTKDESLPGGVDTLTVTRRRGESFAVPRAPVVP